MQSAVIQDWHTMPALPQVATFQPTSTSTSYSNRCSGSSFISIHQHRYKSKSNGPTIHSLSAANGNRQRVHMPKRSSLKISGLFVGHQPGPFRSEMLGNKLHHVVSSRSRRKVQGPVALQQDGPQEFAPALKLANAIETDSLPPFVRDSAMKAIDDLGRRVTAGDVASRAGMKVTQAESALQALAADSGGFLEVIHSTFGYLGSMSIEIEAYLSSLGEFC